MRSRTEQTGFMKSAECIVYLSCIYRISIVYLSCIYRVSIVFVGCKAAANGLQKGYHLRGKVWVLEGCDKGSGCMQNVFCSIGKLTAYHKYSANKKLLMRSACVKMGLRNSKLLRIFAS